MLPSVLIGRLVALFLLLTGLSEVAVAGGTESDLVRIAGQLTSEGVECPTFRAADGVLYSVLGDLDGFKSGDSVCLLGRSGGISFCMRGTPFSLVAIAKSCDALDVPADP